MKNIKISGRIVKWVNDSNLREQKTFRTPAEARAFRKTLETRDSGSETFSSYAARWLKQNAPTKTASSSTLYGYSLRIHINPVIGNIPLNQLTRATLKGLLLADTPSASVRARMFLVIGAVLNEAVRDGLIDRNPSKGINVAYAPERTYIPEITYTQMQALEAELPEDMRLVLWLLYGTGMRPGEARGLNIDQLRGEFIRIDRQYQSDEKCVRHLKRRKEGEYRDVPLPAWLAEKIDKHIATHGTSADGYLFPRWTDQHMSWSIFANPFRLAVKKLKLGIKIPYDFRHIYAAMNLAHGLPVNELSAYMGHRDINLTVNTYGFLLPDATSRGALIAQEAFEAYTRGEMYRTK